MQTELDKIFNAVVVSLASAAVKALLADEEEKPKHKSEEEKFSPEDKNGLVYNEEGKLVVSGKYFGEDFKSGKPELAVVDGSMYLEGCGEFKTTFIFNSTRIETDKKGKKCNTRFIEGLTITSEKGRCLAVADYFDCGADDEGAADILSGDGSAIYYIIAGTGELDSLEGHGLEIYFNNDKIKRRPRNIVLRKSESGDKASCFNYTKALSGKIR